MNNTIKLTTIFSLLFLFTSCTSDDNQKEEPTGKKNYLLTRVNYTAYPSAPIQTGDFTLNYTPKYREPEFVALFDLTYDNDKQVKKLHLKKDMYENGLLVARHSYTFKPKYNSFQQMETLTVSSEAHTTSEYSFSYENELVKDLQVLDNARISYNQHLVYNNLKQFTQATVQTIENEPRTMELAYTYNSANQLMNLTDGNNMIDFSYDIGKNPFDALPFDLTTLILDNIYFVPLTYKFANTLASYTLSTEESPFIFEHTYNEDNYITHTKIYRGSKERDKHYMLIAYQYEVTKQD